ncbi:MAG: phosphatidylserine/phosphatidylglycerophosphate/cardiolipin synthase family protein [Candidatus Ozemobacteraceae bacterium]
MFIRFRCSISSVLVVLWLLMVAVSSFAMEPLPPNPELAKVFASIKTPPGDLNTKIRYLWKNDEALYTRWAMLEAAKKTIDTTYFIVENDIFGWSFLGMLQKKAREGVKIRLMIDGRINRFTHKLGDSDELEELARFPNVEIKLYNAPSKVLLPALLDIKKIFASNHDKIILIDGQLAIIGGRNIGKDYFVGKGEYKIVYRDSDVLMQGDHVCKQLKLAFDEEFGLLKNCLIKPDRFNWKDQTNKMDVAYRVMNRYIQGGGTFDTKKAGFPEGLQKDAETYNTEIVGYKNISSFRSFSLWRGERSFPVKILDQHSCMGTRNDVAANLIRLIDASKHEVLMQNSYVVLSDALTEALKRASARGVKIILHTNSGASTDAIFPQAFFMNDWMQLLKDCPTLRLIVARDPSQRLHSKCFVFDGQYAVVGTYNLDPLSDNVNSEVIALVEGAVFGTQVRSRIYTDFAPGLEYKIKVERDGRIESLMGPEQHIDEKLLKKMNFLRKIQWLRPLI